MADIIDLKEKESELLVQEIDMLMMAKRHAMHEKKFLAKYGTREHAINRMVENFNVLMTEIGVFRSLLWAESEESTRSEEILENEDFRMIVVNQDDMNKSINDILNRFKNIIEKLDSK